MAFRIDTSRVGLLRKAPVVVILIVLVSIAAGTAARAGDDAHARCVAVQAAWLERGLYREVPERAGFAAEAWCNRHGDRPAAHWRGMAR